MARTPGDDWGSAQTDPTERLPWLEPAEATEDGVLVSRGRLIGAFVALLLAIGVVWGGIAWLRHRPSFDGDGQGALIKAPTGPYKVQPKDRGGMNISDGSDTVYATGAGDDRDGRINLSALPETPVTRPQQDVEAGDAAVTAPPPATSAPAAPAPAKPAAALTQEPAKAPVPPVHAAAKPKPKTLGDAVAEVTIDKSKPMPKAASAKPVVASVAVPAAASGGAYALQLGAFSTSAKADQVWKNLSGRFAFLAGMGKVVSPVARDGGTIYRLRATGAGGHDAASALCARLKVAGESCAPVAN